MISLKNNEITKEEKREKKWSVMQQKWVGIKIVFENWCVKKTKKKKPQKTKQKQKNKNKNNECHETHNDYIISIK